MSRIQISVTVSGLGMLFGDELGGLIDMARQAEDAGIDQLVVTDHVTIGPRLDRYPYGPFPLPPEEPWPEPLTLLAAMAGATSSIRLGTGILIVPLRRAVVLAKTLATLDALSNGRLDVGVGVGWQQEEYEAAGVPWEERWPRLDDNLRACRALWADAPAKFSSPSVSFEDTWSLPRPVQAGGPPLWFGVALKRKNVARIVELGSGWMPMESGPEELAAGVKTLRAAFDEAGRSFDGFGVRAHAPLVLDGRRPDLDATIAGLDAVAEAGVTHASFALAAFVYQRDGIRSFFETLGRATR